MKRSVLLLAALLGGCTDTLVYGERTGVNLAVRTDAAEGHPLEVNVGLQRRVVGIVPDSSVKGGEAVNMISSFGLERTGEGNPLEANVTISGSFASGEAAKNVARNDRSVEAIFNLPGVRGSDDPQEISTTNKILNWVGTDVARAEEYVRFMRASGVQFEDAPRPQATASRLAVDERNAALNLKFAAEKNL